ncbi:MAG TPA: hypothetical protein VHE83_13195 [Mycobacteriales bacterium]|nr:hypothetical protein [Mycobacteriales bacterium]
MPVATLDSISCQHCDAVAPADRTMCPSCRRRLRPAQEPMATAPIESPVTTPMSMPMPMPMPPPASGPAAPRSRFGTAFALSLFIACVGVATWVALAATMQLRSALVSFGVAAGIATVMRAFAPHDRRAPIAIVVLTALSALVGLLGSQYELLSQAANLGFFDTVSRVPTAKIPHLLTIDTTPMTWVIMALSVYSGLRMATALRAQRAHRTH